LVSNKEGASSRAWERVVWKGQQHFTKREGGDLMRGVELSKNKKMERSLKRREKKLFFLGDVGEAVFLEEDGGGSYHLGKNLPCSGIVEKKRKGKGY